MPDAIGDICGDIRLRARAEAGVISAVDITSTRPTDVARLFIGKPVEEMCASVGRVFSLCGTAQTIAALLACEAALGIGSAPGVQAARGLARLAEMLTQTTMRLALHWPRALGLELSPDLVRACLDIEAAIGTEVLGAGWKVPGAGVGRPDAELGERLNALDTLLQAADPGEGLARAIAEDGLEGYGALPEGVAPEAGALARTWAHETVTFAREAHGAGLAARLAASRAELSLLPLLMIEAFDRVAEELARRAVRDTGDGEAVVETARGPLTHRLSVEDGIVTAFATEAPTEANFAPGGPAAAGLVGARADSRAAELHVLAIDPCVAAVVDIADA